MSELLTESLVLLLIAMVIRKLQKPLDSSLTVFRTLTIHTMR